MADRGQDIGTKLRPEPCACTITTSQALLANRRHRDHMLVVSCCCGDMPYSVHRIPTPHANDTRPVLAASITTTMSVAGASASAGWCWCCCDTDVAC
jgi:hypothetical protein